MTPSNEALIRGRLVEQYDRFYRLAFSYTGNREDAQDAVQEGACRAISAARQLRNPAFVDTWLYRIMINTAISARRSRPHTVPQEEIPEAASTTDRYRDPDLPRALDALSPAERTILTLHYFEELPLRQIAEILRLPEGTVKSRLYRALKKLEPMLKGE